MRPELTGCIQLPTGAVKLELTLATQALIWRCHFTPLAFVFPSLFFSLSLFLSVHSTFHFLANPESEINREDKKKHQPA